MKTVYYVHTKDYTGDRFVCDAGDHCYTEGADWDTLRMISAGQIADAIEYMTQGNPENWHRTDRTLDEEIGDGKVLGVK